LLEHTVHALVTSVLLRITGLDALNLNAQTQPLHRQLAKWALDNLYCSAPVGC
jgi:hypothetical protein